MPTSKKDREKSNWRRRRNRRPEGIGDFDAITLFKECPTLTELKDALREAEFDVTVIKFTPEGAYFFGDRKGNSRIYM